jgi:hypothetical protein
VWLKELCGHLQGPCVATQRPLCAGFSRTSEYELKDFCVRVAKGPLEQNLRTSVNELKDLC